MIGVLIIVIVAVIAVAILLETPHHARGTTATSTIIHNSSGANSNSIQTGSNSTQQSRVEAELCSGLGGIVGNGGGAGNIYISENESAALVGSGGEYYECEAINYTEIERYNLSGNGITAVYAVYYSIPNSTARLYERDFITNNGRKTYDSFLRSIANMTPMTAYNQSTRNGMIYSYVNIPSSSGNVTDLLGYSGGEVTYISAEAESINTTLLIDTVSSDMQ